MLSKFSLFIVFLLVGFNVMTCAQQLIDVTDKPDVQLYIEFLGKVGTVKKYLVNNGSTAIEPPIPNRYQVFEKKYYKIEADIIPFDGPIYTFKAPANQEDFKKIRILHLTRQELNPNGFEWEDCTITTDILLDPSSERYSAKQDKRLKKFLPDFSQKAVSCDLRSSMKPNEFFVVALQTQPRPTESFTKITWNLESKELASKNGRRLYKLTFTNSGTKDAAEFNLRSGFDTDTKINSFKSSQGTCGNSITGIGSNVCHIGKIPVGKSVFLEIDAEDNRLGENPRNVPRRRDEVWTIFAFFKESPNDPNWMANTIWFRPITKIDLMEIDKVKVSK